jgi:hypothetical protein
MLLPWLCGPIFSPAQQLEIPGNTYGVPHIFAENYEVFE